MQFFNQTALTGKDNKRLKSTTPVNSAKTAAYNDRGDSLGASNVSIPKNYGVEEAKDWVDNGSRL